MPAHTKSAKFESQIAVIGIDIGKNVFHLIGLDHRGAIVLKRKLSRSQLENFFANLPPCLIGMEACVGSHHLSRRLIALGHDARLMPAKYVKPSLKGHKNDYRDAEAIDRSSGPAPGAGTAEDPNSPFGFDRKLDRMRAHIHDGQEHLRNAPQIGLIQWCKTQRPR